MFLSSKSFYTQLRLQRFAGNTFYVMYDHQINEQAAVKTILPVNIRYAKIKLFALHIFIMFHYIIRRFSSLS